MVVRYDRAIDFRRSSLTMPRLRLALTLGAKLYAVIAFGAIGLVAIALLGASDVIEAVRDQKKIELKNLTALALSIVKDEEAAHRAGTVTLSEAQMRAAARLQALRYGQDDYFWINDMTLRMVMHPLRPEQVGRDVGGIKDAAGRALYPLFVDTVKRHGAGFVAYDQLKPGAASPKPKLSYVAGFEPWGWVIGTGVYVDHLDDYTWAMLKRTGLIVGLILLVTMVAANLTALHIRRPLRKLTDAMRALADGNADVVVFGVDRRDEIGAIAQAVETFKHKAIERAHEEMERQEHERERIRDEQNRKVDEAVEAFRSSIEEMLRAVTDSAAIMRDSAREIDTAAAQASSEVGVATGVSQQAAAGAQTVAAAAEELAASIREIDRQIGQAAGVVQTADAKTGRSVSEIEGLAAMSERIGTVVGLIQAIAEQTNLLALNATIEAARAGEAGKGFAVVAQEVKALAAQTAKATAEIAKEVTAIQGSTRSAVEAVREIGTAMRDITHVTSTIAGAVEQQGSATQEISHSAQTAVQGNTTLASTIQAVSGAVASASHSAGAVKAAADDLAGQAEELSDQVNRFFHSLRTGVLDRRKGDDPSYAGPERRRDRRAAAANGGAAWAA